MFSVHVIAANSFILFLIVQRIENPRNIVGHQILKNHSIYINVIGARFRAGCLTNALCILNGQYECILIVELLHFRAGLPDFLVVAVILLHHSENSLFSVCCVQRQNAHQYEIRCNACDQNGSEME